ncbi:MAG: hypothetical protein QG580_300 [Patescibacteria group bacterium]|jgi:hypothetical protein|nr:hypothetical protein [Patescibacteria group bacterium]
MNQNDALKAVKALNEEYVGWYMFVESNTIPGKGIRHAFPKAFTPTEYVDQLLAIIEENDKYFYMVSSSDIDKSKPDYFIYYTDGVVTMYKTLVQALCGESLDRSGRLKLDYFLLNHSNNELAEKFREVQTRYPAEMVRTKSRKNAIIHEKDPVFVIME